MNQSDTSICKYSGVPFIYMKPQRPLVSPQDILVFFAGHFKVSNEEVRIEQIDHSSTRFERNAHTFEGHHICPENRRFFTLGIQEGEPCPTETIPREGSLHSPIRRFEYVIVLLQSFRTITAPQWSFVQDIENLLADIKKLTFTRVIKEVWKDGESTGFSSVVEMYNENKPVGNSLHAFKDYASDINPRYTFLYRFQIRKPGQDWVTIPDPRFVIPM